MKSIEQIIEDQQALSEKRKLKKEQSTNDKSERTFFSILLRTLLDKLPNLLYRVELSKDLEPAINEVTAAVKGIKPTKEVKVSNLKDIVIPEVKIPGSVTVSNLKDIVIPQPKDSVKVTNLSDIKFPEIKIPEQKEVDLSVLVSELVSIKKALDDQLVVLNKKTQNTSSDTHGEIKKGLSRLESVLTELRDKPEIIIPDNLVLIESVQMVKEAINNLKFPVPNVASSWQHSLTMQSEDLAKTIAYIGSTDSIDYMEFVANDGYKYRKTYKYDESGRMTGWTAWEKQ